MKRNQVNDLLRSGAPHSTAIIEHIQAVKETIQLKTNASIRHVHEKKLWKQEYKMSITSIWKAKTELKLN